MNWEIPEEFPVSQKRKAFLRMLKNHPNIASNQNMPPVSDRWFLTMRRKSAPTGVFVDHELVPKHIKLSEKEKKELLDKYKITIAQLPKILVSDPAIAKLNVKPGDIVKICRKSQTSKEFFFYRGVISA